MPLTPPQLVHLHIISTTGSIERSKGSDRSGAYDNNLLRVSLRSHRL